ncbi:hypothetical protein DSO57_1011264 [Entomophthora muscae]|uniref:Uncharacterized protein n=1 Tax=Entomophthora muscae TaxID=34485 RepID=A0ACC2RX81_9FUNG|nr:hypothetical protein DSO57_1011264 [Entomophthora muscae]
MKLGAWVTAGVGRRSYPYPPSLTPGGARGALQGNHPPLPASAKLSTVAYLNLSINHKPKPSNLKTAFISKPTNSHPPTYQI